MNQRIKESKTNKKGYQNLRVWQESHNLVLLTYEITKYFPIDERLGLSAQMRRASVSVSANIVEGQFRHSKRDFIRFLRISLASLLELEYYFELSKDLGYITEEKYQFLDLQRQKIGSMILKLITVLKGEDSKPRYIEA